MRKKEISGVYCIENQFNNKRYIGSSKNIDRRWNEHKRDLRRDRHCNTILQNSWNKHGENIFAFYVLETCDEPVLYVREQFWMDFYRAYERDFGYNINKKAEKPNGSLATTYEDFKNGLRVMSDETFFKVIFYLACTDEPITKIAERFNLNNRTVYQIYYHKNYKHLTDIFEFPVRKNYGMSDIHSKKIIEEIIDDLQKGFRTIDISRKMNISQATIDDIRHHRTWKHMTDGMIFPKHSSASGRHRKAVEQYSLNNEHIATYESGKEAEEQTGISKKLISSVCNGKRKHTHGYIFKFQNTILK